MDKIISATQVKPQMTDEPKSADAPNGLDGAADVYDRDYGRWGGRPSVYTWIRTNPKTTFALAAAAVGATAAVVHEIAEMQREKHSVRGQIKQQVKPYAKQASAAWDRLTAAARDQISQWNN